jgi:hypothetical protein
MRLGRILIVLLSLWPFGASGNEKREWKDAEATLRTALKIGKVPDNWLVQVKELRFGFGVYDGTTTVVRLVHKGQVLPLGGGLPALDQFAKESGLLKSKHLEWGTVDSLVKHFAALPEGFTQQKALYLQTTGKLAPTVHKVGDGFEARFYYAIPDATDRSPRSAPGSSPAPSDEREVECWTLTLCSSKPATWSKTVQKVKI